MSGKNSMSLFSAVLIGVTCMIGSGWLFSSQLTAVQAGNWGFLAWFMAAILVIMIGLCYNVVVRYYPVRGATARSSALSHNGIFGMPFAFANWFGIMVVIATEAQATTQYLGGALGDSSTLSNIFMSDGALTRYGKLIALLFLIGYLMVNYYGVKLLAKVNNVVTVLKVFVPTFAVIVFLIAAFGSNATQGSAMANFQQAANENYGIISAFLAIVNAGLIYSFNGFQTIVSYSSEVKNPKRNVPLSIILSVLVALTLYLLLQVGFMAAVPHQELMAQGGWHHLNFDSPLMKLAVLLGINFLVILLLADSVISPSATGYTYMGSASRMLYAMSSEKQMPSFLAKLHPKHHVSRPSLLLNFILAAIFLWNADSWAGLMVIVTGYHIIGYMAAPMSMGAFEPKKRYPGSVVFALLGLLLLTLGQHDLFMVVISLSIVMLVYGLTQSGQGQVKLIFHFALPFLVYLWTMLVVIELYHYMLLPVIVSFVLAIAVSMIFYWMATAPNFVNACQKHRGKVDIVD